MRLKLMLCGVTALVPALLLTGCGVDQMSVATPNVEAPGFVGRMMGGQQPVAHATITVYAMGTSGYGSTGTILSSTTTDVNGNFTIPAYTCPQSDTPLYMLGIGGNSGAGNNGSAVLGAALGQCSTVQKSSVVLNEVTTTSLAFALSHFFSTTLGGANAANDWFGAPSTPGPNGTVIYSKGVQLGNSVTAPTIVFNAIGAANETTSSGVIEYQKIYTIANILAACINTAGETSTTETRTPCGKLFNWTANGAATRPSDTLQAAVQMALYPTTQVTNLYNLTTTTPAFSNALTTAPNDWSIGVSYTTSSLGIAVNTGTVTTLDIDASGNIWFPSNAPGQIGAAYFDPINQTFNGPYNTTTLTHPQQVAIDANGYAWFNDSGAPAVAGYLVSAPSTTESVSLPNTVSNTVTIGGDDRVNVGITAGTRYEMANISANRSGYSILSGVTFAFPVQSMAGDVSDGDAVAIADPTTTSMRDYYVTTGGTATDVVNANDDTGQVIFSGNDDLGVRSAGTGGNASALCIYSLTTCYNFRGGLQDAIEGIAIDGGKQLWVADSSNAGVLQVPVNNPTGTDGGVYLNSTGATNIPANTLLLNSAANGGGTAAATTPYGIGVDAEGNVWVTNAGCTTTNCTPGTLTLTEIVGAGYPTITPVSAQITSGNLVGTEPTQ